MISMIPRLPLRVGSDQGAHALLCLLRQRPAKMVVDSPDCGDGVARNFVIFDVANALPGQSIAFIQKFVHGFGPVTDCLAADRSGIHSVAKGTAKNSHETR